MKKAIAWSSWPFAVFWLVGIAVLAWSDFEVDLYKLQVLNIPLPHPYP
jgi:hypothetical protein